MYNVAKKVTDPNKSIINRFVVDLYHDKGVKVLLEAPSMMGIRMAISWPTDGHLHCHLMPPDGFLHGHVAPGRPPTIHVHGHLLAFHMESAPPTPSAWQPLAQLPAPRPGPLGLELGPLFLAGRKPPFDGHHNRLWWFGLVSKNGYDAAQRSLIELKVCPRGWLFTRIPNLISES